MTPFDGPTIAAGGTARRMPERPPGRGGMLGVALVSCAALAFVGLARGALRWMRRGGGVARLPR
jgi:hypothetical protein